MAKIRNVDAQRLQQFLDEHDFFGHHLGIRVVACTEDGVITEAELRHEYCNPFEIAHGGFLYAIADTTCGTTCSLAARADGVARRVVTINSALNFLSPAAVSPVRVQARLLRAGRRVTVCEVDISDGSGRLCARGTFTFSTADAQSSLEQL